MSDCRKDNGDAIAQTFHPGAGLTVYVVFTDGSRYAMEPMSYDVWREHFSDPTDWGCYFNRVFKTQRNYRYVRLLGPSI